MTPSCPKITEKYFKPYLKHKKFMYSPFRKNLPDILCFHDLDIDLNGSFVFMVLAFTPFYSMLPREYA